MRLDVTVHVEPFSTSIFNVLIGILEYLTCASLISLLDVVFVEKFFSNSVIDANDEVGFKEAYKRIFKFASFVKVIFRFVVFLLKKSLRVQAVIFKRTIRYQRLSF